ncbi:AmmeMemoRadiSam system radical SAM enzyme [Desulfoplanes sp.]
MKEAVLYGTREDGTIRCGLCAHRCIIKNNQRGLCGVRENRNGMLMSMVYGKIIAEHVDPIEKKPLFHFLPGSKAFSIGTVGCNFHCKHCQNADISQFPQEHEGAIIGNKHTPKQIVDMALETGCSSIAYTYNEPTVFMEFAHDTAELAAKHGIGNVFVSNGYMTHEAADYISPLLDGINIDIKGFSDALYKKVCGARLSPVLETVKTMHAAGVWVEVTTLIIPGHNDSGEELGQIADFIVSVDPHIPWHVTRFHPAYLMLDAPPTPEKTLKKAKEIGMSKGLSYVYEGNIPGAGDENTYCPECGALCVERYGFGVVSNKIIGGTCPECKARIHGVLP